MVWCFFLDQPKIVSNRFSPVIIGVTSSAFLLNEATRKHAKKYEFDTDFVNKILDCFYVDDFYIAAVLRFLDRPFYLRKWRTNDTKPGTNYLGELTNSLQPEKSLEILWKEVGHMWIFDFSENCQTYKTLDITKRNVLKILVCVLVLLTFSRVYPYWSKVTFSEDL